MSSFYIEDDGSFVWKKQDYKYLPPDPNNAADRKWKIGSMQPVGEPQMIEDTRTAYIEFYDSFVSEIERIFITFKAHVKCGKLQEPISILSIERSNFEQEAIQTKIFNEKWEKIKKDKRWIIGSAIRDIRYKITRFFSPISRKIDKLQSNLLDSAREEQFPKEKEYRDSYYE
jgi:hypothetical protein